MSTKYPSSFPPDAASSWRRVRRYAVPGWMIEQATARRLAGDWQGACVAANVDVDISLAGVANQHGAQVATALEQDLRYLAPDLLRWHLPRYLRGRTTLRPHHVVILTGYGAQPADGPHLQVIMPTMIDGPQRLTLRIGHTERRKERSRFDLTNVWATARHLWDARNAAELRERCGGDGRAPFHAADGTPLDASNLPAADPGLGDPAGRSEWATLLQDRGDLKAACGVADIVLEETLPQLRYGTPPALLPALAKHPLALTRLEPEIERLATAGFGRSFYIPCWPVVILLELGMRRRLLRAAPVRSRLRVRLVPREEASNAWWLPEACWRLPDLDLLRFGDITPADLHPLVSASLFPGRAALGTDGPPGPSPSAAVRVRCRGEWHAMRSADGRLQIPHTADEERRERGLRALGGPVAGCFAVQQAWTSGTGRLPRDLRYQHREFFSRVQHGDTPGVLALLEAGVDPRIRDGRQRTLLHLLPLLDHRRLLAMLLRAGLDLEARDHHERTPLHVAVGEGPADLVHVLFDAGARIDVADHNHMALPDLIVWEGRMKELGFLKDAVERAYPELASKQQMSRRDLFK